MIQRFMALSLACLSLAATAAEGGEIYWVDSLEGTISRVDLDGGPIDVILRPQGPNGDRAIALGLDLLNEHIYWSSVVNYEEGWKLNRSDLTGHHTETILPYRRPPGIAVDPARGKVYLTSFSDCIPCGDVYRIDLDGSDLENLVPAFDPRAIAIDPISRRMWWADLDLIRRADFDGGGVIPVVTDTWANGLDVDVTRGKLYWTDFNRRMIRRANLDGSDIEDLISIEVQRPWGIAIDAAAGKMYWTDREAGTVQRANLDGSAIETIVSGLAGPSGIDLEVEPPEAVPTVSEWGLILLGLLLAVTGAALFRRVP